MADLIREVCTRAMASRAVVRSFSNTSFGLLDDGESRLPSFGVALVVQALALLLLISIPILMPQKFQAATRYWSTPIAAPPIIAWRPQPVSQPEPIRKIAPVIVRKPQIVAPPVKLIAPVFNAAKPLVKAKTPAPAVPNIDKPDAPSFSMGTAALPDLQRPRAPVATGGFGDPDSVPANNDTRRAVTMTQLGGYELPNATTGAKSVHGVVAGAGFGNEAGGAASGPGHGTVKQGLFGDEEATVPVAKPRNPVATAIAHPVEILSKPRPVYTDEAKNLKIEGEVLLQVVFAASGQVQVQKVVQGLGHGLDESAMAAARAIRFTPARTAEGQPMDSTAVVHIMFQLAY